MSPSIDMEKRDAMLELLDRGLVMVHLDPRYEGVLVPEWLRGDATLRLNIAYGFNLPALEVDEEGIYAVLSFSGQNHGCTIPWAAVFALTLPQEQHDGQVWPESLPSELIETMAAVEGVTAAGEDSAPAPRLRVVGKPEQEESEPLPQEPVLSETPDGRVSAEPLESTPEAPFKLRLVTD
mgnify:CR=1 FL=1